MLSRDRLIRMQIHQLVDACLLALAFWLTYLLRSDPWVIRMFKFDGVSPFSTYVWLYLIIIPLGPIILEAQGFYNRSVVRPRGRRTLLLFKGCLCIAAGLSLLLFGLYREIACSVPAMVAAISFLLLFAKEEILRTYGSWTLCA